jgi:hypothetical protein
MRLQPPRQLFNQMPTLYRFPGDVASRLLQVVSFSLRHRAFTIGEVLFPELPNGPLHVTQLPQRQVQLAAMCLA